jgi:perosamine synthetase
MKPQRTLPPSAAPIDIVDILHGFAGIVQGKKEIDRFNNGLRRYFGVKHCFLVSSGKAALYCILKALQKLHPDRNEVLVPAFNCYSVPSAVLGAGCSIRLCDVDPHTLDFDARELGRILAQNKRLLCVIPTYLFGLHADVKGLRPMINDNDITIVEDAAQAMGSLENGMKIGLLGDVGFFSLGRGKALSTYEGGIIVTNNDAIGKTLAGVVTALPEYSALQVLRLIIQAIAITVLSHPLLFWIPKGLPFLKIGETLFEHSFPIRVVCPFQAGLAWNWEKKLHDLQARRKANAEWWASYFWDNPLPGISSFIRSGGPLPNLLRFPIRVDDNDIRDAVLLKSEERGMGISATYPLSLDELPELKNQLFAPCPDARACARTLLTLPVHCHVTEHDREEIGTLLARMYDKDLTH